MKLLIVESPGKTKTIKKYLGDGWEVEASFGHVRDLPQKELGIDGKTYQPHYVPTERGAKRLAELAAKAKAAEAVYLATDPDREGEAIAWHLKDAMGIANPKRVTFSEITENAVTQAVNSPGEIDMSLVRAQEARRVLDRLVGYPVSDEVSRVLGFGNSAGRVQSPAVKIVVEREKAINAFKVTTHYGVEFTFEALENITTGWQAEWKSKPFLADGQEYILDKALAEKVADLKHFIVTAFSDSEESKAPSAPFTTASLQQAASQKLKFSPKKTMELAQRLYEAGSITYMRTDSPNLSAEAIEAIQEYCRANNLAATSAPRVFKVKGGAQEAHEAIRPTKIEVEDAGQTGEEKALYRLIRLQALASQMADALFAVRKVVMQSDEQVDGKLAVLEASGKTLLSLGWMEVIKNNPVDSDEKEDHTAANPIPELRQDSRLLAQPAKLLTKTTKPPTRFTEASLVKQLEQAGIGRPATYASILSNIIESKRYLELDNKRYLHPSAAGVALVGLIDPVFCFMNLDFTKDIEDSLDDIAHGKKSYVEVVRQVNQALQQEIATFKGKTSFPCPDCGKPLAHKVKKGKDGFDFWGCIGYPDCKYSATDDNGKPGAKRERKPALVPIGFDCPKCGKALIRRQGVSKAGKDYNFYGCSGFKDGCKSTYQIKEDGSPDFKRSNGSGEISS